MFTGIIEELGLVEKTEIKSRSGRLFIKGKETAAGIQIGDSVAVNGVCLTVTAVNGPVFTVDVMRETFNRTNLSALQRGMPVNLERALRLGDRLGGHFVSGHVDGVGTIRSVYPVENATVINLAYPPEVLKYTVSKGSIAVDGVSLTVVDIGDVISVSIIPHTLKVTTLGKKGPGDTVNLEADMIAKYIEKLLAPYMSNKLSPSFLIEKGF